MSNKKDTGENKASKVLVPEEKKKKKEPSFGDIITQISKVKPPKKTK